MSLKINKKVTCSLLIIVLLVGFVASKMFSKADGNIILEYAFSNNTVGNASGEIKLTSSSVIGGSYEIYWANEAGKLEEYDKIASIEKNGTYKMVSLSAIPVEATKIVAMKDNNVVAQYNIPVNKLIKANKKFSFGALSDIHLDGDSSDDTKSNVDFQNELDYFKAKNVSLICNSGDITLDGRKEDVDAVTRKIASINIPFYTARGNHDCRNACSSMSEWNRIEPNGIIFEKVVNNEVFVFLGLNSDNFNKAFTREQIDSLKNILEKNKNRRVFLFEHVFYGAVGNVKSLYPYGDLPDSGIAGEFKNLMRKYKNVISFTGHSHLDYELQRISEFANVAQQDGEYGYRVHCPSASKPRKNDANTEDESSNTYTFEEGALGYLVDVYDEYIVLTGRDFTKNKNLPYATYILYTGANASDVVLEDTISVSEVIEDNGQADNYTNNMSSTSQVTESSNDISQVTESSNGISQVTESLNGTSQLTELPDNTSIDITVVVDKSMSYNDRFTMAKNAIKQFTTDIMNYNNANIGVIEFGLNAKTVTGLTNRENIINESIEKISLQEGTSGSNMHAGVCNAIDELKKGNASNKVILIISDGRTNRTLNDIKNHNREKSREAVKNELERAKKEMNNLKVVVIDYAKDEDTASKEFLNSIATTSSGIKMYYPGNNMSTTLEQVSNNIIQ